jgi:hypothetical protein
MNKYIKTDIEQGITFLKVAINNALADLEEGREKEIKFDTSLPLQLIIECAEDRGWESNPIDDWTNGWEVDYWYRMIHPNRKDYLSINGSLLCGNTSLEIENE